MKVYDMVEGQWITENAEVKKEKKVNHKKTETQTRLMTYEEDEANRSRGSRNGKSYSSTSVRDRI